VGINFQIGGLVMKKILLAPIFLLILGGCGDSMFQGMESKNTTEAKNFEVSKSLDSGDFNSVLSNPNANAQDYAAAAMGAAGLDPVKLIDKINDIAASGTATKNDIGAVTAIPINPDVLDKVETAKDKLENELGWTVVSSKSREADLEFQTEKGKLEKTITGCSGAKCKDPNLNFQMVMTSLTSVITAIAQVGKDKGISYLDTDNTTKTFDPSDGIKEKEAEALGKYLITDPLVKVDTDGKDGGDTTLVDVVAENVVNVVYALPFANLGADSDINKVLTQVTQGQKSLDYNGDGNITSADLSDYLKEVLGT
jgi:hypothetical protein